MWPLLLLGAVGAYVLFGKKSTTPATSQLAAQSSAYNAAQAFDAQAAAYGLSPADAQNAYDLGLTPAEYVASGMSASSPLPVTSASSAYATIASNASAVGLTPDEYAQMQGYASAQAMANTQSGNIQVSGYGPLLTWYV